MKTFSLLWLFTAPVQLSADCYFSANGNKEIGSVQAASAEAAAAHFGLADTYVKHENGGAWCIAEKFE